MVLRLRKVWMAENLNTGVMVQAPGNEFPTRDNGIVEKLCYEARLTMNEVGYRLHYPNAMSVRCVKDP